MSRRTCDASSVASSYSIDLRQAISEFLPHSGLPLFSENSKIRWVARMLVVAAIVMVWDGSQTITDRFESACRVVRAMWPTRRQPGCSYSGFMKALVSSSPKILSVLTRHLRRQVQLLAEKAAGDCWKIGGWIVFGVDGSRIECPMTAANEKVFGTAGKKKTGPQQFLTTIFHVATGLIWDYRRGDARSSERSHLLVGKGGKQMHLLTNVLKAELLSDEQAEAIYRKRWGIELVYRSLKQTMGHRRMRCDAPANAAVELDWAVIGLWMLGLLSVSRIIDNGGSPYEWSVASSLRAVRRTIRAVVPRPRRQPVPSLAEALATARHDRYTRKGSKKSRHWPHKKREKPPGAPRARNATQAEVQLAAKLSPLEQAA